VAGNGKEACEAVRRQPYDMILMDVQMPEMDGIEATRQICSEFESAVRPRIVALTAGVLPEERQACLDAGMDECLNKPVVREQLVDALQRCERRGDPPAVLAGEGFDAGAVTRLVQEYGSDDVRDLVRAFLQDSARLVSEMREALAQGDAAGLGRAVHRITAPCQALGAAALARACAELEFLVKGGDLVTAAAKFAEVQALHTKASQALAATGLA